MRSDRAGRLLHAVEDLAGQRAAPGGVEHQRRRRSFERLDEIGLERRGRRVADVDRPQPTQYLFLFGLADVHDQQYPISEGHALTSIWPRFDAAAVCTRAECPSRRMVSSIPSAVSGLTNDDAPSLRRGAVGQHQARRRVDHAVLRVHRAACDPDRLAKQRLRRRRRPAATTVPAPSLPTGSESPMRANRPASAPSRSGAVTTGRSGVPATAAADMSATLGISRPRSGGLTGDASTRTTTSSGPGAGTSTSCSDNSGVPSGVTNDRNSRAVLGSSSSHV